MAFAHVQQIRSTSPKLEEMPVFLVKARLAGEGDHFEHMWLQIQRLHGDKAEGKLLNHPLHIPQLKEGELVSITTSDISDWRVYMPTGQFGPNAVPALWRAIRQMDGERSG